MQLRFILLCVLLFISTPTFANNFDLTSNTYPETILVSSAPTQVVLSDQININTADLSTLMLFPGIGKVKAQAIIDYRSKNGSFASCNNLDKVKGIGKKTLEKIRDKCSIK